jgi:ROS/MUCR transcriptional regulator protein
MAEEDWPPGVDLHQVAEIVSSYVRHHKIEPDKLVGLIVEVHRALASLGHAASPAQEPPKPAVPIRRSGGATMLCASNAGFVLRRCAAICGCSMGLRWPSIAPAGIYRRITR